ncbi:sensor histidine kinase [Comamonas terrae]|uniref:histidine kinase n=1 Tax=Comamonas terrae TaxID=673548 RepID=A0ABW5UFX9_9BURK|nr:ATP-binding protein [Comamonas terrae]
MHKEPPHPETPSRDEAALTPSVPQTLEQALQLLAQREQELAALRAVQQEWVHAVSHDLRAPLRHVLSFGPLVTELLQAERPAAEDVQEARSFLQTMDRSARRMAAMFDGLLLLSRAARQPLQWQPVDLGGLLQEQIAQLQQPDTDRVQWQLPPQYPAVRADIPLLRQALQAVLANALKFTRAVAQPRIEVTAERHAEGGGITLTVRDNGVGFDAARAAALFGIFQRMHRETEYEGVGIGLALARTACRRMGGDASIAAAPGQGCSVTLHWPGGWDRR